MTYKFTAEQTKNGIYRKTEISSDSLNELKRMLSLAGLKEDKVGEGYMDEEGYLLDGYETSNKTTEIEFNQSGQMNTVDEVVEEGELFGDYGHAEETENSEDDEDADETDEYGLINSEPSGQDYTRVNGAGNNPMKPAKNNESTKFHNALKDALNEIVHLLRHGVKPYQLTEKISKPIAESYKIPHSDVIEMIEEMFVKQFGTDTINFSKHLEKKIHENKIIKEREQIEESICQLLNNDSNDLLSAFTKIRESKYDNLNDNEISNLAAAFINIIRESQMDKIVTLNQLFRKYFLDNKLSQEYKKLRSKPIL